MATGKRLIDKDALIELCDAPHWCVWMSEIEDFPTVDAVEVVHGQWEEEHMEYVCSCCRKHFTDELPWISHPEYGMPNYCPNCGADMR